MADEIITPPVVPPVVPPVEPPPPTDGDLKKRYDDAQAKLRMAEKTEGVLKTKVGSLEGQLQTANDSIAQNIRIRLAFEAGLPQRLLQLVTGSTEEEVKAQIKLIQDEFGKEPAGDITPPVVPPAGGGSPPLVPPVPPKPNPGGGQSFIERYEAATPAERAKLMAAVRTGTEKLS